MAKNSNFRVGDHIIVIKPCDYEEERGVVTKITDDRVYIQLDDEYEPLDDSFYDEDLEWDLEMLQETAANRYPKGTVFRFEQVDSWRTVYDPKRFHVPDKGTLFAEPGNGVLFRHGAWAEIKGEEAERPVSKYKVGDVVYLNETRMGVNSGFQEIVEVLPDRRYRIKGIGGQMWTGDFNEEWFSRRTKFMPGDIVIGNAKANTYAITVEGWKGEVTKEVRSNGTFSARDLITNEVYGLDEPCFDLFVETPARTEFRFKVGDNVYIDDDSEHFYQGVRDGKKMLGRVVEIFTDKSLMPYLVQWENGSSNKYNEYDLAIYPHEKPPMKFTIGETVMICGSHQCNGYGYMQPGGRLEPIQGVGHRIETIISIIWSDERQEWYYGSKDMSGHVAEHALSTYVPGNALPTYVPEYKLSTYTINPFSEEPEKKILQESMEDIKKDAMDPSAVPSFKMLPFTRI